jgi:hypothetical protein
VIALLLLLTAAQNLEDFTREPSRWVTLEPIPQIKAASPQTASSEDEERIRTLIASFAGIQHAKTGLDPILYADSFPLLPETVLPREGCRPLVGVVRFGPKAIPFLLKSLEDATPTLLVIEHRGPLGGLFHGNELDVNPANAAEVDVYRRRKNIQLTWNERYVVTVGDVCFLALGQIAGRRYLPVRPQPTNCIYLNRPSRDPEFRALVRKAWEDRPLLQSLLLDWSTRGVPGSKPSAGWILASDLQAAAAMRLLYYYPDEAGPMIAARIQSLDAGPVDDASVRIARNGVYLDSLIGAVSWSTRPEVRDAVVDLMKRTRDPSVFRSGIPAAKGKDDELVLTRLKAELVATPTPEAPPLLKLLVDQYPAQARPIFEEYLRDAGLRRLGMVSDVLRVARPAWTVEVLAPQLADSRTLFHRYFVADGTPLKSKWARVCDEAAMAIAATDPTLVFVLEGDLANLDRQIEGMKTAIAARRAK